MKSKKVLSMTMVMIMAVLILLSACTMEDIEYIGDQLKDIQSNVIDTTALHTLDIFTIPPIETAKVPQTTPAPPQTTGGHTICPPIGPNVEVPKDGIIETAEQLHAVLINGDKDADYTVVAKELDMSPYRWKGMVDYSGTFDFGGCVIKGAANSLFVSVKGGTIKNLVLAEAKYIYMNDDAEVDIDPKTGEVGNLYYSPVVRYAENITISNVTVQSSVTVKADIWYDQACLGGIVGAAEGDNILIENCHFNSEIVTDSILVNMGGIAGSVSSANTACVSVKDPETSSVRITNCSNTGKVINLAYGNDSKIAGVVGKISNGVVIGCGNYGQVDSNDAGQSAGVVGYVGNVAYVKNCINTASVRGAMYVGGICGYSNGAERYFENCINLGAVSSQAKYFGGIIGLIKNKENLTNCFNLKDSCEKFMGHGITEVVDPADSSTYGDATLTNCANLSYVEDILRAIKDVAPSVFQMAQNGLLELS